MADLYNDILCLEYSELVPDIISVSNFKAMKYRGIIKQIRKGGNGRSALIEFKSLPDKLKQAIIERYGNITKSQQHGYFRTYLKPIPEAIKFYATYKVPSTNKILKTEVAKLYHTNAMFLTACHYVSISSAAKRKVYGVRSTGLWQAISEIVNDLQDEYQHDLPANYLRLKEKTKVFITDGFASIISGKYGNNNGRVVTEKLENLLLSIYCMPNKPYANMVLDIYLEFLSGKIELFDIKTGELFQRSDFFNDKGQPIIITEASVWNYINEPYNRALVDSLRNDFHYFNGIHRPHYHRHEPDYSFSLISLDDRDMPQNKDVKAYYAYDAKSRCLIGAAYSKDKDKQLFMDCMRNMFRFINTNGYGFPMEVQVEHHLVNKFKDDLMKAGVLFPFVRWCNPGNSQEKVAEGFIKQKKYGFEKRYNDGIGRWNLSEANRPKQEKKWTDEDGMVIKEKLYSFEEVVATDLEIIELYNNSVHPNQKKYKGMTRMDVLRANINPKLPVYEPALVARYVGEKTQTSIRRNQYLQVQYAKYQLPEFEIVSMLEPNNYNVDAYYLPSDNIEAVYIYQNDNFLCECKKINEFNIATSEQTEVDYASILEQAKYVSHFDKEIKEGKKRTAKIGIIKNDLNAVEIIPVIIEEKQKADDFEDIDLLKPTIASYKDF